MSTIGKTFGGAPAPKAGRAYPYFVGNWVRLNGNSNGGAGRALAKKIGILSKHYFASLFVYAI